MNQVPGDQNRQLTEYIDEIKTLRQLIPICAHCKSLRNSKGEWETIEDVLTTESVDLTHGICPACLKLHYPDFG